MSQTKKIKTYTMVATVGCYPSETATWYLVEIPQKIGLEIHENFGRLHRGFGSLPVAVTIGQTTWRTSIFRSNRTSTYMLFLKAAVRKKEGIEVGDKLTLRIQIEI